MGRNRWLLTQAPQEEQTAKAPTGLPVPVPYLPRAPSHLLSWSCLKHPLAQAPGPRSLIGASLNVLKMEASLTYTVAVHFPLQGGWLGMGAPGILGSSRQMLACLVFYSRYEAG